jgi:glycine betaine/proline transport system substrate-binding protein
VGDSIPAGGLQGFLIDKVTAKAHDIERLDQIADDPALAALFDLDGDGKADLIGCNEGWGCQVTIDRTIEANGWAATIEQVNGEYNDLWAETVARFQTGQPVLAYTWTPSAFIMDLQPGKDVVWLSLDNPLPEQIGATPLSPLVCPGQPCEMGFVSADIRVVGNAAFLAANPAANRLFEIVGFPLNDVGLQNVRMALGEDSEADIRRHAAEWIVENRGVIDAWLNEARKAAAP